MNSEVNNTALFHEAIKAIDSRDVASLRQMLKTNPALITMRLNTPGEEGYFKYPYLLWFVAGNPVRHERLPVNIVEVAEALIEALKESKHENYQFIVDYTLGLVCTGRIPGECGVQIPLMELLVNSGASIKGSVLGAIGQHNFQAAEFLLDRGADYNLATAVGLNKPSDLNTLLKTATASDLYVALVVAAFFGRAETISLLIKEGANVNGSGTKEDFGGFHSHATPLHQAVSSGSLESVKILVEAGADPNASDNVYNGTPLGWAIYMQTEENDETRKKKLKEIQEFLSGKQKQQLV